jgi:hypothetical protein
MNQQALKQAKQMDSICGVAFALLWMQLQAFCDLLNTCQHN